VKARSAVTPVALVVLAVAAVGYAYVFDRRTPSDADREGRRREVLPSFAVGDVRRVELVREGERLVLERASDAGASPWAMRSPRQEPADPAAVDALLRELDLAIRLRDVDPAKAAGLDSPRVRGVISVGPLEYRFALGASAPVPEGASYMRVEGEGTFVVGSALSAQLLRGVDAYRDRVLVPLGAAETQRLEVRTRQGTPFALVRSGKVFRLDGGPRASRSTVERIFAALSGVRAEAFVPDDEADRSVAAEAAALTLVVEPTEPGLARVEIHIGGACPGDTESVVAIRTSPDRRSACVPKGVVESLRQAREGVADDSPFYARKDEVAELRLEPVGAGSAALDVARRGAGWHERSPEDRDLSASEVDAANVLVERLTSLRATEPRLPASGEHVVALTRATIVRVDGATEIVELGAPTSEGKVPMQRQDDGAILKVPAAAARDFDTRGLRGGP
jgi:hypothetical protein